MLGYASNNTYRSWDIVSRKVVIGRNVTFNEKSILHRAKVIEIFDSQAESEADEGIDSMNSTSNDDSKYHSADEDGTGDCKNNSHSTKTDCTGNKKIIHSASPNGIGNNGERSGSYDEAIERNLNRNDIVKQKLMQISLYRLKNM